MVRRLLLGQRPGRRPAGPCAAACSWRAPTSRLPTQCQHGAPSRWGVKKYVTQSVLTLAVTLTQSTVFIQGALGGPGANGPRAGRCSARVAAVLGVRLLLELGGGRHAARAAGQLLGHRGLRRPPRRHLVRVRVRLRLRVRDRVRVRDRDTVRVRVRVSPRAATSPRSRAIAALIASRSRFCAAR